MDEERKEALMWFCVMSLSQENQGQMVPRWKLLREGRLPEAGSLPHSSCGCSCHSQGLLLGPSTLSFLSSNFSVLL